MEDILAYESQPIDSNENYESTSPRRRKLATSPSVKFPSKRKIDDELTNYVVDEEVEEMMDEESREVVAAQPMLAEEDDSSTHHQPYTGDSQLEYLEDGFSLIGLFVRSNAARIKDDMK
jgi:hypothetical protein